MLEPPANSPGEPASFTTVSHNTYRESLLHRDHIRTRMSCRHNRRPCRSYGLLSRYTQGCRCHRSCRTHQGTSKIRHRCLLLHRSCKHLRQVIGVHATAVAALIKVQARLVIAVCFCIVVAGSASVHSRVSSPPQLPHSSRYKQDSSSQSASAS